MNLAFMEKETSVAESTVSAQGTTEFSLFGMFAVLMVQEGLLVFSLVAAILALKSGYLIILGMFGLHVLLQLIFAFAGKATDLTNQRLALMTQLVAAQLISPMATIRTLVTLVPSIRTRRVNQRLRQNISTGNLPKSDVLQKCWDNSANSQQA